MCAYVGPVCMCVWARVWLCVREKDREKKSHKFRINCVLSKNNKLCLPPKKPWVNTIRHRTSVFDKKIDTWFFSIASEKKFEAFFPDPGAAILFLFLLQFPKTASGPPEFVLRLVLLKRLWGRSPETKFNLKCFRVMRGCKWSCFWECSCLGLEDYSEAFFKIASSW